jgi:hypothetical protein
MVKQMQKIEELTLYVIDQNKELSALKKENTELRDKLSKINQRLQKVERY